MDDRGYYNKLLIDENLSRKLVNRLQDIFPESIHVSDEDLLTTPDKKIWDFAQRKGYCILTRDWDYKFMSITLGCPPKIIRLNCGNQTTINIFDLIYKKIDVIRDFLHDQDVCYLEIE